MGAQNLKEKHKNSWQIRQKLKIARSKALNESKYQNSAQNNALTKANTKTLHKIMQSKQKFLKHTKYRVRQDYKHKTIRIKLVWQT